MAAFSKDRGSWFNYLIGERVLLNDYGLSIDVIHLNTYFNTHHNNFSYFLH